MKLTYQYQDKLFWIHNFLPENFYKKIHKLIYSGHKDVKQPSKEIWDPLLIKNLKSPFRIEMKKNFFEQYCILLKHQPFLNFKDSKISFLIHKMQKGSGINWHSDNNANAAATYFINNRWSENWGGEFMFKDKNSHGYIPVVGNSLILIKTPLMHKVNNILSPCISRLSIQSFVV